MRAMLFVLLALRAATAGAQAPSPECQVWERERSFAESVARHDKAAFAAHIAAGAVFDAASPQPLAGRDAIIAGWTPILEEKGVSLAWRPHFVSAGIESNVAMSRGPYVLTTWDKTGKRTYAIGEFVSVWTRQDAKSPWFVILDGGGPAPMPVTEAEAKKHLAAAPASCLATVPK